MFSIVVQKIYKSVNQWIFYNTLLPQVPILIAIGTIGIFDFVGIRNYIAARF